MPQDQQHELAPDRRQSPADAVPPADREVSRRAFQHASLVVIPLLYVAALIAGAARYLLGRKVGDRRLERLAVGERQRFLDGDVERVQFNEHVVYILADGADRLIVKRATCPHLACNVNWVPGENEFHCPCHGMVHTRSGEFVRGPVSKPLADQKFEVTEEGEVVLLDEGAA